MASADGIPGNPKDLVVLPLPETGEYTGEELIEAAREASRNLDKQEGYSASWEEREEDTHFILRKEVQRGLAGQETNGEPSYGIELSFSVEPAEYYDALALLPEKEFSDPAERETVEEYGELLYEELEEPVDDLAAMLERLNSQKWD